MILGIDPGIGRTGWGIAKKIGSDLRYVACGCIETKANLPVERRLGELYRQLKNIIDNFKPDQAGVETLIFNTNAKTALVVGQARGVILLLLEQKNIDIKDFTPLQIKQAVAGYGRATKDQVQKMVKSLLKLDEIPKPDDAADALAVAITLASTGNFG